MKSRFPSNPFDNTPFKPDLSELKKAELVLKILNNSVQQKIIKLLEQQGKLSIREIYERLYMEQSDASVHLTVLRKNNFVNASKAGKLVFYELNLARMAQVQKAIRRLL